jgi:V/A-type H+-transporting ATPase subunit I
MKKLTLFTLENHKDDTLAKLRKLSVVHIRPIKPPTAEDIISTESELNKIEKCLSILGAEEGEPSVSPKQNVKKTKEIVDEIISLDSQRSHLADKLNEKREKLSWFEKWGDVFLKDIEELKKSGIYIRLYATDKSFLKKAPKDKIIKVVNEDKNSIYITLISDSEEEQLELKEEIVPTESLTTIKSEIVSIEKNLSNIENRLVNLKNYREIILGHKEKLAKQLEFLTIKYGMGVESSISYLQGYCPIDAIDRVKKKADKEGWGYLIEEPDNPEEVPTLIRNPKWIRIVNPVFQFMGTLPGYNEFDISFWFLCFFSIFFAMLIGDAGYGVVFLLLSICARKKFKNAPNEPFLLIYVLSVATIVWGAITGTWFGFEQIARLPFLNYFVIDKINSFAEENQDLMMYITFVIGVIHLTIAHALLGLKVINSVKALAQLGWIFIIWGIFFLAGTLVLDRPLPGSALLLIGGGAILVLLFANYQKKHFLKGIGTTIGSLPLDVISSFADIVSYLRLFAVGYATVIVASSFNEMAIGSGINSVISGLVAAFILLLGHSLNIILGIMSVIVHGIRLNMLEFSSHLGMQWSGKKYEPFKE